MEGGSHSTLLPFPPSSFNIMQKATLNSEQATFLIKHLRMQITKDSLNAEITEEEYKEFILLVQIYDILTGNYKPKNNLPDESLRGNDSCSSGKCD